MTSNLGTRDIQKGPGIGFAAHPDEKMTYEKMKDRVMDELKKSFRPEFLNRLVEDPLSEKLLWKEFRAGQTIIVDARDGEIVFEGAGIPPDVPPVELAGSQEA